MVLSTIRYHKLVIYNREETYATQSNHRATQWVSLFLMYLFIAGYIVGLVDTARRQVEPIYAFVAVIFFLGGIFIFFAINTQNQMAVTLREKTRETMKTFVNAIDMKDAYTKGHSTHVYAVVKLLFECLPDSEKRSMNRLKLLDAALLHDIGKISIDDEILNNPGQLSRQDWDIIKTHPRNGKKMLDDTCYREISDWVLLHHERMDGTGYYGTQKEDIPIEARIIAIADMYCALCTDRVYRGRKKHDDAIRIMLEAAGTQLDEALVNVFLKIDRQKLEKITAPF